MKETAKRKSRLTGSLYFEMISNHLRSRQTRGSGKLGPSLLTTHRYVCKVFALDTRLNLEPNSTKIDLQKALQGHVIAEAQMIGRYGRK